MDTLMFAVFVRVPTKAYFFSQPTATIHKVNKDE